MNRSLPISGVIALAVFLFSSYAAASTPLRATNPLPDARILSAAPFEFRADSGIFSRMPGDTSDANIFHPRGAMLDVGAPSLDGRAFQAGK